MGAFLLAATWPIGSGLGIEDTSRQARFPGPPRVHSSAQSIAVMAGSSARGRSLPWAQPPGLALKAAWARSEPQVSSPQLSPSSVPHHQVLHQRRSIGRL